MARVGVFTYDFFPFIGGMGRHVHAMYQALANRDFLFFSAADNQLPGHVNIGSLAMRKAQHFGLNLRLFFIFGNLIARWQLELVNIHTGPGGLFLLRQLPVPVIVTCHHTYWQQSHYIRAQFWKRIFIPLEKRTFRLAAKIICDCNDTKQVLMARYNIAGEKITVVSCAVDSDRFCPGTTDKKPCSLLYVGRIDKRKGVEFLIRSMRIVVNRVPDACLSICGTGADLNKMRSLSAKLNLEKNINFLGFVEDEQLPELYRKAQCTVVPSVFEGFGLTVIESIACGTRVIGTDADGIRETLADEGYGRLVPFGDVQALADAVVAELQNPEKVKSLHLKYQFQQLRSSYLEALHL